MAAVSLNCRANREASRSPELLPQRAWNTGAADEFALWPKSLLQRNVELHKFSATERIERLPLGLKKPVAAKRTISANHLASTQKPRTWPQPNASNALPNANRTGENEGKPHWFEQSCRSPARPPEIFYQKNAKLALTVEHVCVNFPATHRGQLPGNVIERFRHFRDAIANNSLRLAAKRSRDKLIVAKKRTQVPFDAKFKRGRVAQLVRAHP